MQVTPSPSTVEGWLKARVGNDEVVHWLEKDDERTYIQFEHPEDADADTLTNAYVRFRYVGRSAMDGRVVVDCPEILLQAPVQRGAGYVAVNGLPYIFKSITYVIDLCGRRVGISACALNRTYFGDGIGDVSGWFESCSRGNVLFDRANNLIVRDVPVTCKKTCGNSDLDGWMAEAESHARTNLGIDVSRYKFRVLIIPNGAVPCPFAGLADLGCFGRCSTFLMEGLVKAGSYGFAHELGHNMGLKHATSPAGEYGDTTSAMGGCCKARCFNAPQTWQLGWNSVLRANVTASGLKPNVWTQFRLDESAPVLVRDAGSRFWVSVVDDKVLIHVFDGKVSLQSAFVTKLVGTLRRTSKETWQTPHSDGFYVRGSSSRAVSLCRGTCR